MKIVIDENITYGKEAFENLGEVTLLPGREITNALLVDKDALFVRSVTNVNKELLQNTNIKFVGTATIGTDHIDEDYLSENNIGFCFAPGCNSYAVTEYVFSAITYIANKYKQNVESKSIGIVGYGNIGTKVAAVAEAIGMKVVLNDPPLQRKGHSESFFSLEEALGCDIVTLHVPLNPEGIDKTHHLLNEKNISLVKEGAILINASRGPVINNEDLKRRLIKNKDLFVVLDVWENEPDYDKKLNKLVEIGTAHIAGYSFEGKVNGTTMVYDQFCDYKNLKSLWTPDLPQVNDNVITIQKEQEKLEALVNIFDKTYLIKKDDLKMREAENLSREKKTNHTYFDSLRKNYRFRRELNNYFVKLESENKDLQKTLKSLRLNILEK